jgi:membrane-bound serine protease (ClpP class)
MNLTDDIYLSSWLVVIIIICIVAFLAVAIIWGIKAHRLKVSSGKEDMIGESAQAITVLDPKGMVLVEGEQWTAISEAGRVEIGEEVTITRIDGLKIYVTKNKKGGK